MMPGRGLFAWFNLLVERAPARAATKTGLQQVLAIGHSLLLLIQSPKSRETESIGAPAIAAYI
eukprot:scaffold94065_cov21-Tisochrysis_lutea.AAC.1